MEALKELFKEIFQEGKVNKIVFADKRLKSQEVTKLNVKPVILQGVLKYQFESVFQKKVTHENLSKEEAVDKALSLVKDSFKQINIFLTDEDIQVLANKVEKPRIVRKKKEKTELKIEHNRTKKYVIPDNVPCDFLIRLGVMDEEGKVFQKAYSKFRQINRYLEIVEDVYPYLDKEKTIRIIDFGCGKAYLTFALYHYLKVIKERDVEIIGLDLKEDVISFCNDVAKDLGYDELKFLMGDIVDYTSDHADMVVTLHACDTATDYALINAVNWNTKVILSVPCCQHELFKQIDNDIHEPMLKHGILKDRLTEYLTDGLRGLKLEEKGYDVSMIEFTTLEHTAKNIMIKAIKDRPQKKKMDRAKEEFDRLVDFYKVSPTIAKL